MKKIKILDTTLRDGEQSPGCSMHINEKLEIAESLQDLGVDIIEAGFPVISDGDFKAVSEIAALIKNCTVAGLSRCVIKDIDAVRDSLKGAADPRIHLFIATSPIHLEYKLKMTQEQVIEAIKQSIAYAKKYFSDIQFSFEDASRTPIDFLLIAAQTAVNAGAKTINIPDTVGYSSPAEINQIFTTLKNNLENAHDVTLSTHNHNDLGLAVANSIAAVQAGAEQIEGTFTGIGERAGNSALEEIVMGLDTRKNYYNCLTGIDTKKIYRVCKLISSVVGSKIPPNKAIIGANAFAHEAGIHQHGVIASPSTYEIMSPERIGMSSNKILLGKHSGRHAFEKELKSMGYDLNEELLNTSFERFKDLADKKKNITRRDIEAILPRVTRNVIARKFELASYEATTYKGGASAEVTLTANGKNFTERETGDGPVDAAYKAINNIMGKDMKLADFSIHSVTEGKDALGEATVKLLYNGEQYSGYGVSTDVLESAIYAYINAANKLEETEN